MIHNDSTTITINPQHYDVMELARHAITSSDTTLLTALLDPSPNARLFEQRLEARRQTNQDMIAWLKMINEVHQAQIAVIDELRFKDVSPTERERRVHACAPKHDPILEGKMARLEARIRADAGDNLHFRYKDKEYRIRDEHGVLMEKEFRHFLAIVRRGEDFCRYDERHFADAFAFTNLGEIILDDMSDDSLSQQTLTEAQLINHDSTDLQARLVAAKQRRRQCFEHLFDADLIAVTQMIPEDDVLAWCDMNLRIIPSAELLLLSAQQEHKECFDIIIHHSSAMGIMDEPNEEGNTIAHIFARSGDFERIIWLTSKLGLDITAENNAGDKAYYVEDKHGRHLLMRVAKGISPAISSERLDALSYIIDIIIDDNADFVRGNPNWASLDALDSPGVAAEATLMQAWVPLDGLPNHPDVRQSSRWLQRLAENALQRAVNNSPEPSREESSSPEDESGTELSPISSRQMTPKPSEFVRQVVDLMGRNKTLIQYLRDLQDEGFAPKRRTIRTRLRELLSARVEIAESMDPHTRAGLMHRVLRSFLTTQHYGSDFPLMQALRQEAPLMRNMGDQVQYAQTSNAMLEAYRTEGFALMTREERNQLGVLTGFGMPWHKGSREAQKMSRAWNEEHFHEIEEGSAKKETALVEKDTIIAKKETALVEKDTVIAKKETALVEKDTIIAEKETALVEKDTVIAEKETALIEKDTVIDAQAAKIAALREELRKASQGTTPAGQNPSGLFHHADASDEGSSSTPQNMPKFGAKGGQ